MSYPTTPKQCRRKLRKPTTNTLSTNYSYCSLYYIRKVWGAYAKPSKGRRLSSSSEKSGDIHGRGEQTKPEPTREKTYYTSSEGDSDEDDYEDANNNNSY